MLKMWYLLIYVTQLMTTYITRISHMIAHHCSGTLAILCGSHQIHCSLQACNTTLLFSVTESQLIQIQFIYTVIQKPQSILQNGFAKVNECQICYGCHCCVTYSIQLKLPPFHFKTLFPTFHSSSENITKYVGCQSLCCFVNALLQVMKIRNLGSAHLKT